MNLKLKRTPGIYLVGFMGSGKSTIGRRLADELGWNFVDIDAEIEKEHGALIGDIFATRGEGEFRRIEHQAICRLIHSVETGHPVVAALGGGAFAQEMNVELLKDNGISIWLDIPLEIAKVRVARTTHRPLARDAERFERLYAERRVSYEQADYRIAVGERDPREHVKAILALPIFE
jgi:shikimate kinase